MKYNFDKIEIEIYEAIATAIDANDVIMFDEYTTLYEEIIIRLNKWFKENNIYYE